MTRFLFLFVLVLSAVVADHGGGRALAQTADVSSSSGVAPPYEIVRRDIELEADPNGQFWEYEEVHYRPLAPLGIQLLQKITLKYTADYQDLGIAAYTLKKDGRKLEVPPGRILQGHGDTTRPGFADTRTMTVVFPDLDVGDEAVLLTRTRQNKPWFPNVVAENIEFPRTIAVKEASIAFTTRGDDAAFHIAAFGLDAAPPQSLGGKTRHVWHYRNDTPAKAETDAVTEIADAPHVEITTLSGYPAMAQIYAGLFKDKAKVTPEIATLAQKLTQNITDKRAQARALYDWVAAHIQYVDIVLGAGGFEPHEAGAVLASGYGDCKDHVMLLGALLAAKGIESSPVLIRAGENQFRLPGSASPFLFDHLISYLPQFQLYLDSTARYAPFGVLPTMDSGKTVVIVETGKVAVTPMVSVENTLLKSDAVITIGEDGSANGDSHYVARGPVAVDMRAMMAGLPPDSDAEFFRNRLGPGSDGKFQRGNPEDLGGDYNFSAHYHLDHMVNVPGPGALPAALAYKPFSFSLLIGQGLPASRQTDYVCTSGVYEENVTVHLPNNMKVAALPQNKTLTASGLELRTEFRQSKPDTIETSVRLRLNRPGPVCTAADYARQRPGFSQMVGALLAQIVYQ